MNHFAAPNSDIKTSASSGLRTVAVAGSTHIASGTSNVTGWSFIHGTVNSSTLMATRTVICVLP